MSLLEEAKLPRKATRKFTSAKEHRKVLPSLIRKRQNLVRAPLIQTERLMTLFPCACQKILRGDRCPNLFVERGSC